MPCQQAARSIRRLQENVHHLRDGLQLMAAQTIKQGLHLMGQLGHVRKPEGGRTSLDRVSAAEDAVELFVVGTAQVQIQEHLLHLVEVLTRFLEKI